MSVTATGPDTCFASPDVFFAPLIRTFGSRAVVAQVPPGRAAAQKRKVRRDPWSSRRAKSKNIEFSDFALRHGPPGATTGPSSRAHRCDES